jgi:trehalose 6-phosphate synthase/phosphatase
MDVARLVTVSNRLPVSAQLSDGAVLLTPASGGLATGLGPWHEASEGLWIGWPGDASRWSALQRADLDRQLAERRIVPVHLSRDAIDRFYHGFANRVVWPLFHYLIDRVPVDATGWDAYREANEAFAEAVIREHRAGDTIWVHDYQLMLVPALLRERLPHARIGFFLHIPFPSSEVFRVLPWRRRILEGLLGADLVGFHTFAYMRHFLASLLHVEGIEADIDRIRVGDREVSLGVFPMGVDSASFAALARDPEVAAQVQAIRRDAGDRRIVLGIDRLDYTKGIPRRLQAIERMLSTQPALAEQMRFIQVAVPSRGEVDSYQRFKRQVEEAVGRINGACGTLSSTPVHYMHQSVPIGQLVALYCAADVMLVTPLRDGMNLVAKEFVASRADEDGVLVLSEFAGAAAELDGAVVVNPYDIDGVADAIRRALAMPPKERRARMRTLRHRVMEHDVHRWARTFLTALAAAHPAPQRHAPEPCLVSALADARRAQDVRLLLDYDGTLVPLARAPELAAPDEELLALLSDLSMAPGITVELVSGRPREPLQQWFGDLPIALWAEHGFWHRAGVNAPWVAAAYVSAEWLDRVLPILQQFTASTPGSRIEAKSASVAWHYRGAHREFGARQAHELRMLLGDALSNQPLEVLEGSKVIEVRLHGIGKAVVSNGTAVRCCSQGTRIVAIGDDMTDDELFRALPAGSLTIAVGPRPISARFRVDDYRAVRRLLRSFLRGAEPPDTDPREAGGSPQSSEGSWTASAEEPRTAAG